VGWTRREVAAMAALALLVACAGESPTSPPAASEPSVSSQAPRPAAPRFAPRSLAPRPSTTAGLIGTWGGDHVRITVGAARAILEYDCAHGSIDQPFAVDPNGRFDLTGTHVVESPGPVSEGNPPAAHPARYTGSTDGRTMTFTVTTTDSGQAFGPFTVTLDAPGRVFRCA